MQQAAAKPAGRQQEQCTTAAHFTKLVSHLYKTVNLNSTTPFQKVIANVATGPRPTAGGAAGKAVQINMLDEGFDGPGGNKGLFTSTNPEMRRVVPDDVAGRVKVKVVYTVLEAQYQSALTAGALLRGCLGCLLVAGEQLAAACGRIVVETMAEMQLLTRRPHPHPTPTQPTAVKAINATNKTVCFEIVGYLLEELRDPDNLASFKEDLASANVFIGSLIFIEELAEKVRALCVGRGALVPRRCCCCCCCCCCRPCPVIPHPPPPNNTLTTTQPQQPTNQTPTNPTQTQKIVEAVGPVRERLDACVVFPSMPAVMKLNKLGTFSMAQLGQSKSMIGEFIKSARQNNDNFEEGLLKLVRTLPKVLKYLPSDKAQDARNFVQSLQYWLGGNSENLQNFLLTIAGEYVPALQGVTFEVADPELFPEVGIWHPMATTMYEDLKEYLNWCVFRVGFVLGLFVLVGLALLWLGVGLKWREGCVHEQRPPFNNPSLTHSPPPPPTQPPITPPLKQNKGTTRAATSSLPRTRP
jgi:hypothetical protein